MLKDLTVLFPTRRCPEYTSILIRSFEKFKPKELTIKYIVVENSEDETGKSDILSLSPNVMWIQNPLDMLSFPHEVKGSFANAIGVEVGLKYVTTQWVFIAHCDTCVTSQTFFEELSSQAHAGKLLIGTVLDNTRVHAIHVSGYLTLTYLARRIDFKPVVGNENGIIHAIHDVGDGLDLLCRTLGLKTFCFKNSHNGADVVGPFKEFAVDRCLDSSGNVMFIHLGRGIYKMMGQYTTPNKVTSEEWIRRCTKILNNESP